MSDAPAVAPAAGVLEPLPAELAHRILLSLPLVARARCECVARAWCAALRAAPPAALDAREALGALRAAGVPLRPLLAAPGLGGGGGGGDNADEDGGAAPDEAAAARVVASLARRSGRALRALTLFGDAQLRAVAPVLSSAATPPLIARLTLFDASASAVDAFLAALPALPAHLLVERCAVEACHLAAAGGAADALRRLLALPARSGALRLSLAAPIFRDDNPGDDDEDPLADPRLARLARLGAALPRAGWRRVRVCVSAATAATLREEFSGDGASLATLFEALVAACAAAAPAAPPPRCVLDLRRLEALAVRDGARIVRDAPPHRLLRVVFGALACPAHHAATLHTALLPDGAGVVTGVALALEEAMPHAAFATALATLRACAAAAANDEDDDGSEDLSCFELSIEGEALDAACLPPLAALLDDDVLTSLYVPTCLNVAADIVTALLLPPLCASRRLRTAVLGGAGVSSDVVAALAAALSAGRLRQLRVLTLQRDLPDLPQLSLDAATALGAALSARAAPPLCVSVSARYDTHGMQLLAALLIGAHPASAVVPQCATLKAIVTQLKRSAANMPEEARAGSTALRALAPALLPALLRILEHHVSSGGIERDDDAYYEDDDDNGGDDVESMRWWPLTREEARAGARGAHPGHTIATVLALLDQVLEAAPKHASAREMFGSAAPMLALAALARRAASQGLAAPAEALAARRAAMRHLRAGLLHWARRGGAPRDASAAALCEIAAACRRDGDMPTLLLDADDEDGHNAVSEARAATMALLLACGLACNVDDASLDAPRAAFAAHAAHLFRAIAARAARAAESTQQLRSLCEAAHCLEAAVRVPPLRSAFLADVSASASSADATAAANVLRELITTPWLHVAAAGSDDDAADAHAAVCAAAAAYKALALALCALPGAGAGGRDALRAGWGAAARLRHDAPGRPAAMAAITRVADARCSLGAAAGRLRGACTRAMTTSAAAANAATGAELAADTARAAERGAASVELLLRLVGVGAP
jgi:hypothetical protein